MRRITTDLTMCYKLLNGLTDTDYQFTLSYSSISQTRGNSLKLNKRHLASTRNAPLFHHRIINLWNALPDYIVTARSVSCFKCYLITQTMLEMTFLLLVTISIVWYVFFAFNILFFFDQGRAPVSEDLDLPWCRVMYFTYCLITM